MNTAYIFSKKYTGKLKITPERRAEKKTLATDGR